MGCGPSNEVDPVTISPYELDILKNETQFNEAEIKNWHKAFMQEHRDGLMDKNGFVSLYSQLYPEGTVDDFSEHLFATYDTDCSGTIDFREFISVMNIANKGTPAEKLTWAFGLYDIDKSGQLTRAEVTDIVTAVYKMQGVTQEGDFEHLSVEASVREIFKALEKDGDGQISKEEFVKGAQAHPQVQNVLTSI